jgi:hypothetical protein
VISDQHNLLGLGGHDRQHAVRFGTHAAFVDDQLRSQRDNNEYQIPRQVKARRDKSTNQK